MIKTRIKHLHIILFFRTLLFKLVEKSLTSKHPQLMLRRTESIVEKMLTNWLALAMYDYMKDYAGSSLFVLFKAIKFQVCILSWALHYIIHVIMLSLWDCESKELLCACAEIFKSRYVFWKIFSQLTQSHSRNVISAI